VIIACGQKRSNDIAWSDKVIDLAGNNFDVLAVHNDEYESDLFESGVRRIRDYRSGSATTCARRRIPASGWPCSSSPKNGQR